MQHPMSAHQVGLEHFYSGDGRGLSDTAADLSNTRQWANQPMDAYGYGMGMGGYGGGYGHGGGGGFNPMALAAGGIPLLLSQMFGQEQQAAEKQPGMIRTMAKQLVSPSSWLSALNREYDPELRVGSIPGEFFDPALSNPVTGSLRMYSEVPGLVTNKDDLPTRARLLQGGLTAAGAAYDAKAAYNLARSGHRMDGAMQLLGKNPAETRALMQQLRNTNLGGPGLGRSVRDMARHTFTTHGNYGISRSIADWVGKVPGLARAATPILRYVPGIGTALGVGADVFDIAKGERSYITNNRLAQMGEGAATDAATIAGSVGLMAPWVFARNTTLGATGTVQSMMASNRARQTAVDGGSRMADQMQSRGVPYGEALGEMSRDLSELGGRMTRGTWGSRAPALLRYNPLFAGVRAGVNVASHNFGGDYSFNDVYRRANSTQRNHIDDLMSTIQDPNTSPELRRNAEMTLRQAFAGNATGITTADAVSHWNKQQGREAIDYNNFLEQQQQLHERRQREQTRPTSSAAPQRSSDIDYTAGVGPGSTPVKSTSTHNASQYSSIGKPQPTSPSPQDSVESQVEKVKTI